MTDPRPYVRMAADVRRKINEGIIKPSDSVTIAQLRKEHGHARQTCIKTLRLLAAEGLLRWYPGVGYYVRSDAGTPDNPREKGA
jgi:DNA-binding GntR family transcriptional regulator